MITNYFTSRNIAHNVAIVKGDSFSSPNSNALRSFIWFRQSVIGKLILSDEELSWEILSSWEDVQPMQLCLFGTGRTDAGAT